MQSEEEPDAAEHNLFPHVKHMVQLAFNVFLITCSHWCLSSIRKEENVVAVVT